MAFRDIMTEPIGQRPVRASWPQSGRGPRARTWLEPIERRAGMRELLKGIERANADDRVRMITGKKPPRVKLTCEPTRKRKAPWVAPAYAPDPVDGAVNRLRGVYFDPSKYPDAKHADEVTRHGVAGMTHERLPTGPEWGAFKAAAASYSKALPRYRAA